MSRKHRHPQLSAAALRDAAPPARASAPHPSVQASTPPPSADPIHSEFAAASGLDSPRAGPTADNCPAVDYHAVDYHAVESPAFESHSPLLTKLLKIADMYRADESIHQAMSIYFELAEEHAGTPEAYEALERLLDIAKNYEDAGEIRQARSLYERLLD